MRRMLYLILTGLLLASPAIADPIDPDPNSMGIYFDLDATIFETSALPASMVPVHIILTNPDFPSLKGYGFDIEIDGDHVVFATNLMGEVPIDVGPDMAGAGPNNHYVGLISPMPTTSATLLCTLDIFVPDTNPIAFTLHGFTPYETDLPKQPTVFIELTDVYVNTGVSAGLDGSGFPNVCAVINGSGVVGADQTTLGQVKSLYR